MQRLSNAFPTEYQYEFTKKKFSKPLPCRPVEYWEVEAVENSEDYKENAQKLLKKFSLERFQTNYQLHYNEKPNGKEEEEEIDLGNELITYLKQLYNEQRSGNNSKQPYSATRVIGYASPGTLHVQLSTYQDTHGRTGGKVILKNFQKNIAAKRRRMIQPKLQANPSASR